MNHNICVGEEMSKVEDIQGEKGENFKENGVKSSKLTLLYT